MLVPDPKVVRELLTRYASLRIAQAERETPATARELADVSYTLCVMMGTTSTNEAVAKADELLIARTGTTAVVDAADPDEESDLSLAV
ncbi:DUF5133 domain-containing protein [Streptomyces sp. CRN 30]|uniref:DUF5133 domain-containing protein n=1 Tax=Streptomyces sp. CRN 30 TaxID=3075613 RepID=UPI002A7FEC2E|nr:DUF5133 domain-containing protein [Streptomyces sp. CRN 30]